MFTTGLSLAQKNADVPLKVRTEFSKHYTDPRKMSWEVGKDKSAVTFTYHRQHMTVTYTNDGSLIATETRIPATDLPDIARAFAEKKGSVSQASKIVRADNTLVYEAEVGSTALFFDKDGRPVKD